MPQLRYYRPSDLASVLGVSARFVRMRLAEWAPERACGAWWRLDGQEAAQAVAFCLARPRRAREGRPVQAPEVTVTLGLLAAMTARAQASSGGGEPTSTWSDL